MSGNRVSHLGKVITYTVLVYFMVSGWYRCEAQEAGPYREIPVPDEMIDQSPEGMRARLAKERRILDILRNDSWPLDAQQRNELDRWLKLDFFAVMTRRDHLDQWVPRRQDFENRLMKQVRTPQMREFVIGITRQVNEAIVRGNFHPVARYNAMLWLGTLNTSDPVMFGTPRPAVPMIEMLRFMLDELANPQQIDPVRVAALVGVGRHVRLDRHLPAGSRRLVGNAAETMIVNAMLGLAEAKEPPEGRSSEAHAWMQRRAIEILGMLGSTGQGNRVVTVLEQTAGDDSLPIAVRCSAADALGQLNYPANIQINAVEIANRLGAIAVLACREEIKRVEDQIARDEARKKRPVGGGGMPYGDDMYGGDMYGGDMLGGGMMGYGDDMYGDDMYGGDMYGGGLGGRPGPAAKPRRKPRGPLGYRIDLTRRVVTDQLLQVKRGLTGHENYATEGLAALTAAGNGQADVNLLVASLNAIIEVAENPDHVTMDELLTELRASVQKMEDDCGILVSLPGDDLDLPVDPDALLDSPPEGMLDLPLDPPDTEDTLDVPADPLDPGLPPEDPADEDPPIDPDEPQQFEEPSDPADPTDPADPDALDPTMELGDPLSGAGL